MSKIITVSLFSDGTNDYCIPPQAATGETLAIRIRSAKDNCKSVYLMESGYRHKMESVLQEGEFEYFEAKVVLSKEPLHYYFQLVNEEDFVFFGKRGPTHVLDKSHFFTYFPNFFVPEWTRGAIMYQIMVDRFYNKDPKNDVLDGEYCYLNERTTRVEEQDWYKAPSMQPIGEFYGGDLLGVIDKLDYLVELGIEVIYLNPIFVSPSNHKYDTQDYDSIDPHFGRIIIDEGSVLTKDTKDRPWTKYISRITSSINLKASNQLFALLVEKAHERGIRVILDGVFNHCGSFHKWMDKEGIYMGQEGYELGAYHIRDSVYHSYFQFANTGSFDWPNNSHYEGWWNFETLPKLNYDHSRELWEEILRIGKKWVSPPYNADGWRLDVAADLAHTPGVNHLFWKEFRQQIKQANPQAVIIAEHYGDPQEWLAGDEWDTIMNYGGFMEPISWYLTGMEKHSDEFRGDYFGNYKLFERTMIYYQNLLPTPALYSAMNQLSNHDHSRFLTRTNQKAGRVETLGVEAANEDIQLGLMFSGMFMHLTWPGAPALYYADEAGQVGFTDPDNRRTYPWGMENTKILSLYKALIRIRKEKEVLRTGSFTFLNGKNFFLVYGRFNRVEKLLIAINTLNEVHSHEISLNELGMDQRGTMVSLITAQGEDYSLTRREFPFEEGKLKLTLTPMTSMILEYCC